MIKRLVGVSAALVLGGGLAVAVPGAATSAEGPTPPHSHLHVNGVVVTVIEEPVFDEDGEPVLDDDGNQVVEEWEWPVSIKGCRPLANNRAVPLHAHHAGVHTGRAGEALWSAGNAVVPVFQGAEDPEDNTPWTDCASLYEFFGLQPQKGRP